MLARCIDLSLSRWRTEHCLYREAVKMHNKNSARGHQHRATETKRLTTYSRQVPIRTTRRTLINPLDKFGNKAVWISGSLPRRQTLSNKRFCASCYFKQPANSPSPDPECKSKETLWQAAQPTRVISDCVSGRQIAL